MQHTIDTINQNIQSGGLGQIFGATHAIAGILFAILIATLVYVKLRIRDLKAADKEKYIKSFVTPPAAPIMTPNQERWTKIEQLFMSPNESDWRVGIIEADAMLDEFINSLGYPGTNLGDRLKNIDRRFFPTLDVAWEAHKIRNRIAHEGMEFKLSERDKETARKNFELVLRDAKFI